LKPFQPKLAAEFEQSRKQFKEKKEKKETLEEPI
jgi:hypothetical protein